MWVFVQILEPEATAPPSSGPEVCDVRLRLPTGHGGTRHHPAADRPEAGHWHLPAAVPLPMLHRRCVS